MVFPYYIIYRKNLYIQKYYVISAPSQLSIARSRTSKFPDMNSVIILVKYGFCLQHPAFI